MAKTRAVRLSGDLAALGQAGTSFEADARGPVRGAAASVQDGGVDQVAFNLVCASILGNDLFGADFCVK